MEQFIESFAEGGDYILRLFVAMALGGVIGLERQVRGRSAGLRTNILVCLGSAAVIIAFQKLYDAADPGSESAIRIDPARAAAGVITGVGFLGAGTIVKSKSFVRGLTTAASIWVVSAVGITVGLGDYASAVVLTALVLLTLFVLHRVRIPSNRFSPLTLDWRGDPEVLDEVIARLESRSVRIRRRSMTRHPQKGDCRAYLSLQYREEAPLLELVGELQADPRFERVSWN
jgi:putative Mg2+ transporter-C (MgtC) family protein